jgi:hypothetical protein
VTTQPCTEHHPIELTAADTGEVVGAACGNCGWGWLNATAFASRTHIPIDPVPSRSLLGTVVHDEQGESSVST